MMKICPSPCNTHFSHPTREKCSKCSGWSCAKCGRPKSAMSGKETCERAECNMIEKVKRRRKKTVANRGPGDKIVLRLCE